jgi:hypothetical protein
MKQKDIAIVHYNTPELTEAAILSVRKHCQTDYRFTVFDNSDKRPFTKKMAGVKVIDNTKGQIIDFEAELAKYPDKEWEMAKRSNHGSFKHIITVQKLWELLPGGFILLESDVLITRNFDFLWNEDFAACGKVQRFHGRRKEKDRLLPWLCYLNVPLLTANGARYFDPMRCWNLQPGEDNPGNWWDTGACVLDDIRKTKPQLVCRCYAELDQYYIHYNGGSWRSNDLENQKRFIEQHKDLWYTPEPVYVESKDVAICAIVRCENKYLREWIDHHFRMGVKKFFIYDNGYGNEEKPEKVLYHDIEVGIVEVIDYRNQGGTFNVQDKAYNDCYAKHGHEYGWIGFLDIDELIQIKGNIKLPTLLSKFKADAVALSWQMMTDSGHLRYQAGKVLYRFQEPVEGHRYPGGEEFVKCFVRGGIDGIKFESQPHMPVQPQLKVMNVKGESVKQYPTMQPIYTGAWVNHYHTKSAEEFVEKVKRGFPNGDRYTDDYRRKAIDYFFAINTRTPEKEIILNEGLGLEK